MRAGHNFNTAGTANTKQRTAFNSKASPTRASPKSAAARASPNGQRVASPKSSTKAGLLNGAQGTKPGAAKAGYNTAKSNTRKQMPLINAENVDKGGTRNTHENATVKDSQTRLYGTAKVGTAASPKNKTTAAQKSKLKQPTSSIGARAQNARKAAGAKGAPVSAHNYTKSAGPAAKSGRKNSFQQNIETYDAAKGRPSLMDIDNKQVFEGNYLPASFQQESEQATPQMGQHLLSSTNKSASFNSSSKKQPSSNKNQNVQSPATLGQISVKGINGPSQTGGQDYMDKSSLGGTQKFNSSQGMKFKKKSQIEEKQLNKILDSRARISINSQTGKHEFKYCHNSTANLRTTQGQNDGSGQGYLQNSDSLVNFINDHNGGQLDQMAPIRPSNLIWQMPFEERRSFINQQCEFQLNRLSKIPNSNNTGMFGSGAPTKPDNHGQGGALFVDKQESAEFQKANGSDSEFEHFDDYIDEAEEFNGASNSVKFSIRALNFNMMLAEKQSEQDPGQIRKVSLLSRASHLVQNANKNESQKHAPISQKNYDRSSKLLNMYIKQQNSQSARDSYLLMSGIDERDEFDEYSHTDSVHSNMQKNGGSRKASSRGSTISNQYQFPTFFTPNQSNKKMTLDHLATKHSGTTTGQGKQIKFFSAGVQKPINYSQNNSQRTPLERSVISEKEQEDSQAVEEEITGSEYNTGQHSQAQGQRYVSGKFSQKVSMMQESFQEEPEDPDADVVDDDDTGNCQAADEGYSEEGYYQDPAQDGQYIHMGRNSRPSAHLQMASQFSDEVANETEQQTQNTFHKYHQGGIVVDDPRENDLFQQTQQVKQQILESGRNQKTMKQSQSHAVSAVHLPKSTHENVEEQTEERFVAETGNSQPTSFVGQNGEKGIKVNSGSQDHSLQVVEQNSSEFNHPQKQYQKARLKDANHNLIDTSIHYYDPDGQVLDSGPTQRSGAFMDNHIQQLPGQNQVVNLDDSEQRIGITERTDDEHFNDSFQNEETVGANNAAINQGGGTGYTSGDGRVAGSSTLQQQMQQNQNLTNASHSPTTLQHSGLQSSGYPYVDRLRTTERNPLTMSEGTTIERGDHNFGAFQGQEVEPNPATDESSAQLLACSYDQPQEGHDNQNQGNALNQFVTKVPQADAGAADGENSQQNLHQQHFVQTVQALQFIQNNIRVVEEHEMSDLIVQLPPPRFPDRQKKLAIFDMDETLIHCVDDIETQDPDIVLEIDFPDEETVYAGINIRPYIMECLEEANKHFQVIAFTASHQVYADAILDYIDPNHEFITHRLYRQHCFLTEEGYYVKDLRIFADRDLKDVVIVDNSVYSFAFQIDNGIPIIPFYNDKQDEEMLHLVYYLNCLAKADDVREQNRQAFELFKLSNGESLQNSTMATEAVPGQYYDNDNQDEQEGFFGDNELVDLTNGNQYAGVELHDPALVHSLPQNADLTNRHNYQIDDVIHEDCREDFNSYNESAPKSKHTDESNQQQISGEHYHQMAGHQVDNSQLTAEQSYKNIDEEDAYQFTEEPTDEETSPVLYNLNANQISSGHMQMQYSHQQYPTNQTGNTSSRPDGEEDILSASNVQEENSLELTNNNSNTVQYGQQQQLMMQQLAEAGEIMDQDDDGGNFFLGTEGEQVPAEENSNCYRLSSQMDELQDPYTRPSKLLQNEESDGQYEELQKQIQNSLNCDFQGSQNQQQFQFIDQKGQL